jgi:hypothetical protein
MKSSVRLTVILLTLSLQQTQSEKYVLTVSEVEQNTLAAITSATRYNDFPVNDIHSTPNIGQLTTMCR